jgi:hypothetical protein
MRRNRAAFDSFQYPGQKPSEHGLCGAPIAPRAFGFLDRLSYFLGFSVQLSFGFELSVGMNIAALNRHNRNFGCAPDTAQRAGFGNAKDCNPVRGSFLWIFYQTRHVSGLLLGRQIPNNIPNV